VKTLDGDAAAVEPVDYCDTLAAAERP